MPTHDFKNIGEVLDFEVLKGVITTIDSALDTCLVSVGGVALEAILFYHCEPDSVARANGAIEGAAAGFSVNDEVIVLKKEGTRPNYLDKVVKVIGHTDGARHCNYSIAMAFLSRNSIKLKLANVTKKGISVISECAVSGLTINGEVNDILIPGNDRSTTQITWDYNGGWYQLFTGTNVYNADTLCTMFSITKKGVIENTHISELRWLPSKNQNPEVVGDSYRYIGSDAYCLYDKNWAIKRKVDPITGEPINVEGSLLSNYYAFRETQWPTYSSPQPHYWSDSIISLIVKDTLEMVFIHGWKNTSSPYNYDWRIFYEDSATHIAREFLIDSRAERGFGLSTIMCQVEDKLWYWETRDEYSEIFYWFLGTTYTNVLRIADINNPLDFRIAQTEVSEFTQDFATWTMSTNPVQYKYFHSPTKVIKITGMTYCKEEGVVLISKLRWDNPHCPSDWTGNGPPETLTAPEGTLTQYIDAYDVNGVFLYTKVEEVLTVPSVWSYSPFDRWWVLFKPLSYEVYDAYDRHLKIAYIKKHLT